LGASQGLAAGTYTLLPARYALLPGASLVTPVSGTPVGSVLKPGGASLVSGYRANNLDGGRVGPTSMQRFEVAPGSVVRKRSEFQDLFANTFLNEAATARGFAVPRLPSDAGYLSFSAISAMSVSGRVMSSSTAGAGTGRYRQAQLTFSSTAREQQSALEHSP